MTQILNNFKNIFLWIAVAPAALIAYLIVYYGIIIINQLTMPESESIMARLFIFFASNIGSGYAFVYTAAYVAPQYKKITAIIAAVIMIFMAGMAATLGIQNSIYGDMFAIGLTAIGSIAAGYTIYKDERFL